MRGRDTLFKTSLATYIGFLSAFSYVNYFPGEKVEALKNGVKDSVMEKVEFVKSFYDFPFFLVPDSLSVDAPVKPDSLETRVESSLPDFDAVHRIFESTRVPVLMFHEFGEREDRYTVSPRNFERILYDLYVNDFYSVSLDEFVSGDFSSVPVGKKPVLLTFDDAPESQFRINNDGSVCSRSAVGVMESFYDEYDFGRGGVFFVSYGSYNKFRLPFAQNDFVSDKLKFLIDNGYDVAYHTVFHNNNTGASMNNIFEQNVVSSALFHKFLGEEYFDKVSSSFAHPFGASPSNGVVFDYLASSYESVFDAWGGASKHPLSSGFDVKRITRIEITHQTLNSLVLGLRNTYRVTPETEKFYDFVNTRLRDDPEKIEPLKPLYVDKLVNGAKLSEPIIFF